MIYDETSQINRYLGLHPNLDEAIHFIQTHDLNQMELGKHLIKGEEVYCTIMEAITKKENETAFEIHHAYMDIQMDLKGKEEVQLCASDYKVLSFDDHTDFGTVAGLKSQSIFLNENTFVMLFPKEAHKPSLAIGQATKIKKIVFKVKMQ